jgi:signal transduction histidine kinase
VGPQRTVRLRLTAIYGTGFVVSGLVLVAIIYALLEYRLSHLRVSQGAVRGIGVVTAAGTGRGGAAAQQGAYLHQFLVQAGIALAVTAVFSVAIGWLGAGRALRPLRTMIRATRRISERNLHERLALAGPGDELKDLGDTIDGLLGRLDEAFGSQRRFVANASHELRTPLMLSQTLLQVALADPDLTLGSLRGTCQEVLLACKEQERLIQALLTLARSQRGLDHSEPVDLAEVTANVLGAREAEAAAAGLHIDADLHRAVIDGDPRLTEILIGNLLENAIRHNVSGGTLCVTVSASGGDGHVTLAVSNTGPDIPPGQIGRLLQPFQRLDGDRGQAHEGLGLGLSIIAAIAAAHNASLSVRPRPAGGLSAEVRFPPARQAAAGCIRTEGTVRVRAWSSARCR